MLQIMGIIEKTLKMGLRQDDNDGKVIDLSDNSQYPASVLADQDFSEMQEAIDRNVHTTQEEIQLVY